MDGRLGNLVPLADLESLHNSQEALFMVKNPPGSLLTWRESISSATTFIDCSHSMRFRMLPVGNMNGSILQ